MLKELQDSVCILQESEAKKLLVQLLLRIDMMEESEETKELRQTVKDFLAYSERKNEMAKNIDAVHIVFSDSTAGSLKVALGELGIRRTEKVICISENFSIGPLRTLQTESGLAHRYDWLEEHLICEGQGLNSKLEQLKTAFSEIASLREQLPVFVWTGNNANEQLGVRFLSHLMAGKRNPIHLINTTTLYQLSNNKLPMPLHTDELSYKDLKRLYELNHELLSIKQQEQFQNEWMALARTTETLRVWKNNAIKSVEDTFFDATIIETARSLHGESESNGFLKSARLIGEVIGQLDQPIGDSFLEYRVRWLSLNGFFEMKGVPKAMRFYSVKLR